MSGGALIWIACLVLMTVVRSFVYHAWGGQNRMQQGAKMYDAFHDLAADDEARCHVLLLFRQSGKLFAL